MPFLEIAACSKFPGRGGVGVFRGGIFPLKTAETLTESKFPADCRDQLLKFGVDMWTTTTTTTVLLLCGATATLMSCNNIANKQAKQNMRPILYTMQSAI